MDTGRELLRAAGLRATSIRMAVLSVLRSASTSGGPLTVQAITDRLGGDADRVTVYRTLNSFVESGIAHKLDPGDRVFRFAIAAAHAGAAASSEHAHPHFVCDECGAVECLDDAKVTVRPARRGSSAPSSRPFRIRSQEVVLHGTCGQCEDSPSDRRAKPGRGR